MQETLRFDMHGVSLPPPLICIEEPYRRRTRENRSVTWREVKLELMVLARAKEDDLNHVGFRGLDVRFSRKPNHDVDLVYRLVAVVELADVNRLPAAVSLGDVHRWLGNCD